MASASVCQAHAEQGTPCKHYSPAAGAPSKATKTALTRSGYSRHIGPEFRTSEFNSVPDPQWAVLLLPRQHERRTPIGISIPRTVRRWRPNPAKPRSKGHPACFFFPSDSSLRGCFSLELSGGASRLRWSPDRASRVGICTSDSVNAFTSVRNVCSQRLFATSVRASSVLGKSVLGKVSLAGMATVRLSTDNTTSPARYDPAEWELSDIANEAHPWHFQPPPSQVCALGTQGDPAEPRLQIPEPASGHFHPCRSRPARNDASPFAGRTMACLVLPPRKVEGRKYNRDGSF